MSGEKEEWSKPAILGEVNAVGKQPNRLRIKLGKRAEKK